jgi:hypothetical protein
MSSRLNVMRYGSIAEVSNEMDGDRPLNESELRALVFNLVDVVRVQQKTIDEMHDKLVQIMPELS